MSDQTFWQRLWSLAIEEEGRSERLLRHSPDPHFHLIHLAPHMSAIEPIKNGRPINKEDNEQNRARREKRHAREEREREAKAKRLADKARQQEERTKRREARSQ